MTKQTININDNLIRTELILEWPKLSHKEVDRVVSRHGELKEVLRFKYDMTKESSVKCATNFFNTYRNRTTT